MLSLRVGLKRPVLRVRVFFSSRRVRFSDKNIVGTLLIIACADAFIVSLLDSLKSSFQSSSFRFSSHLCAIIPSFFLFPSLVTAQG